MTIFLSRYKDHELVEERTFARIKSEKRMILDTYNTFQFYLLPGLLAVGAPIAAYYNEINAYIQLALLPLVVLAAFVTLSKQKKDLKFHRLPARCSPGRFKALAKQAEHKLCWQIDYCDTDLLRAYFFVPLLVAPTMITILRDNESVLINCISYPYRLSSSQLDSCRMNIEDFAKLLGIKTEEDAPDKRKKTKRQKKKK